MSQVRQWELLPNVGVHVHRHEDGTRVGYEAGEVIHDPRDLSAMFPNKFGEVGVSKPQTKKKSSKLKEAPHLSAQQAVDLENTEVDDEENNEVEEAETVPASTKSKSKKVKKSVGFGEEVTGSFPQAAKADLKIFFDKKKRTHTVVDADDAGTPLAQGLKKPKNVEKWIKTYLKGE